MKKTSRGVGCSHGMKKHTLPKEGVWMEENIDSNCNGHIGRT